LKDKISIAKIYKKAGVKKVGVVARTLKFRYAGHTTPENKDK